MQGLSEYSAAELIEKLNNNEISVLRLLGADKLRREMKPAGILCKLLADYICLAGERLKARKKAILVLRKIAPLKLAKDFPKVESSIIVGFNHPTLGEIFRFLLIAFETYQDRELLFPVNIPWYENITPIIPKLDMLGIHITPMITPSTEGKLKKLFEGDDEKLQEVQLVKNIFERRYMRMAREAAKENYVTFVAPSATRQAKVIGDHIHPTMTILAHMVYKKGNTNAVFLPAAVIEPKNGNREMNLFKPILFLLANYLKGKKSRN